MGSTRKLVAAENTIEELHARLREVTEHAWTMQLVVCCLLEKLCPPNGTCLLDGDLRRQALDLGWGVRTEILPGHTKDAPGPMVVILEKPSLEEKANLEGAKKLVVPVSKKLRRR